MCVHKYNVDNVDTIEQKKYFGSSIACFLETKISIAQDKFGGCEWTFFGLSTNFIYTN